MTFKEFITWEQNINLFSGDSRKNIEETIAFPMFKILNKIIGQNQPIDCEELELIDEVYLNLIVRII
jgi:peptide chain release factor 3